MKFWFFAMTMLLVGCVNIPALPPPPPAPNPTINTGIHNTVRGVFCGLVRTDAKGSNPCPGADVDAITLSADASACGVTVVTLLNEKCTWGNIKDEIFKLTEGLNRGDMLVFGLSGHGTQMRDEDGDEADGMDEALCLYADLPGADINILRDDYVMTELLVPLWSKHPGLDVLFITDTCHSQGNFRSMVNWVAPAQKHSRLLVASKNTSEIDGGLIQIAMCREESYSYGNYDGGTGTQALLRARKDKIGRLAAYWMTLQYINTEKQEPQWVEYGAVSDMFRNGEFWK